MCAVVDFETVEQFCHPLACSRHVGTRQLHDFFPLYFIDAHWILQRSIAFLRDVVIDERMSIYDMLETRFVGTSIY